MKKLLLPLLAILFLFSTCKKDYYVTGNESLFLSVEKSDSGMHFNWSAPNTDTFFRYELYASSEPLPTYEKLDNNRNDLICTHLKLDSTKFDDLSFRNISKKYFRVYAFMGNGVLSSPNVENPIQGFTLEENIINNESHILKFEELNQVYIINKTAGGSRITILDYEKNEIIVNSKWVNPYEPSAFKKGIYKRWNTPISIIYAHVGNGSWEYTADADLYDLGISNGNNQGDDELIINDHKIFIYKDQNNIRRLVIYNTQTRQNDYWGTYRFEDNFIASRSNPSYFINTNFGGQDSIDIYRLGDGKTIYSIETKAPNPAIRLNTPILSDQEYLCLSSGQILDKDLNTVQQFTVPSSTNMPSMDMDQQGNFFMYQTTSLLNGDSVQSIKVFEMGNSEPIKVYTQPKANFNFIDKQNIYSISSYDLEDDKSFFYLEKKSFK